MFTFKSAFITLILAGICVGYFSCGKNSVNINKNSLDVEYKILNAKHTITSIFYTGPAGDTLTGDVTTQSDTLWSKTITITKRPFTAVLQAGVTNTDSISIDFLLEIFVNGVSKNIVERSIPPQAATTATVEFAIQ